MAKFHFDPQAPLIRLYGHVRGDTVRRVQLILDTGASRTTLPPLVLRGVGLDPDAAGREANVTTASGSQTAPILTINRLDVLGHSVNNLDITCLDLPNQLQIDGLLGLNFLRHFKLYINFSKGVLVIHERKPRSFFHRIPQMFEILKAYW